MNSTTQQCSWTSSKRLIELKFYPTGNQRMTTPKIYTYYNAYGNKRTAETYLPDELNLRPVPLYILSYLWSPLAHDFGSDNLFTPSSSHK